MKGSIRRRGKGSWELTIDLGRGPDGKRQRKFMNVKGLKVDADRRLREVLGSLDRGLQPDTGKITVGAYMAHWHETYAVPNTRPRTAERYLGDIRLHIVPAIGHIRLAQLRAADVQQLEARLLAGGKSATSVRHVHVVLKEGLKHAVRWGLVHVNVADAVDPPKVRHQEVRPPTMEEVLALLNLAGDTPYGPPLTFLARTGVRRGECLGLRWTDLDLERGIASIVQSLQRIGRQGLQFVPVKSAKSRRAIALDGQSVDMLRDLRGQQILREAELGSTTYNDSGLVFPGPFGDPLDPATLTRNFERLAQECGLSHVRLHDLRHFHATVLLQAGTHLKVVQERLGHASIAITADTYSHVAPGLQRSAAESFAEAMDGAAR